MPEHSPAPTPSRSIFGFVMYLGSLMCIFMYLAWAYVPMKWLQAVGITSAPQKYWAIALPTFLLTVGFTAVFCIYPGINFMITLPFNSIFTIKDEDSHPLPKNIPCGSIPPAADISIADISQVLHLKK